MTDPIQRLGIGVDPTTSPAARRLAQAQERLGATQAEWALLTSLATAAPLVGVIAGSLFGSAPGLVLVIVHVAVVVVIARRAKQRRARQIATALPAALEGLARDLRTGASFGAAVARQADGNSPMASQFRRVHGAIELGQAVDQACGSLTVDSPHLADDQTAVGVLAMVSGGGRGSARALDEAAHSARQRQLVRDEVRALVAQAESSVRMLAGLPVLFVGFAMMTGQEGATALIDTAIGRWCLVLGLVLDGAGLLWMRALVSSVIP